MVVSIDTNVDPSICMSIPGLLGKFIEQHWICHVFRLRNNDLIHCIFCFALQVLEYCSYVHKIFPLGFARLFQCYSNYLCSLSCDGPHYRLPQSFLFPYSMYSNSYTIISSRLITNGESTHSYNFTYFKYCKRLKSENE